jgi:hypothetical protein
MSKPGSRWEPAQKPIRVSPAVHERVTAIKKALEGEKTRQVTYSETLELLADAWDRWQALAADVEA